MKITSIYDDTGPRCKKKTVRSFQIKRCFWASAFTVSFLKSKKENDTTQKRRLRKIAAPALLPGTFGRWIQAIQKVPLWLRKRLKVTVTSRRITRGITSLSHDVVPKTTLRHAETVQSPLSLCSSFLLQELAEQSPSRDHVRQILVSVPRPLLPRFSTPGHPNRILFVVGTKHTTIQETWPRRVCGSVIFWKVSRKNAPIKSCYPTSCSYCKVLVLIPKNRGVQLSGLLHPIKKGR